MATYEQIQEFVKQKYGYTPKTCWIAHAKEVYDLPLKTAHNRYSLDKREKPCPIDKLKDIQDAFYHFGMLESKPNYCINNTKVEYTPKKLKTTTSNYVTSTSDKRKVTAFLLCLFGGLLGFHQFYVGKIGKGLIYIFTMGLCGVGWFVDLFKIALGSFRDNVGEPLRK